MKPQLSLTREFKRNDEYDFTSALKRSGLDFLELRRIQFLDIAHMEKIILYKIKGILNDGIGFARAKRELRKRPTVLAEL